MARQVWLGCEVSRWLSLNSELAIPDDMFSYTMSHIDSFELIERFGNL